MSTVTAAEMLMLVSKAAVDPTFRDELLASARNASKSMRIALDSDDLKELQKIADDLRRYGGNRQLHPDEARGWALGVCQVRTMRTRISTGPKVTVVSKGKVKGKSKAK